MSQRYNKYNQVSNSKLVQLTLLANINNYFKNANTGSCVTEYNWYVNCILSKYHHAKLTFV